MRVRNRKKQEDIELQMTPMIDIVFQLLVFFIMTFKIVPIEGDFSIKMPIAVNSPEEPKPDDVPAVRVVLKAGNNGQLKTASWDGAKFFGLRDDLLAGSGVYKNTKTGRNKRTADLKSIDRKGGLGDQFIDILRKKVEDHLGNLSGTAKEKAEIEFECDYNLKYVWTIRAVTAANGKLNSDGKPIRLIEKIKFTQAKKK